MDYLLFFTICVAATFSPGPAVLLTVKNSAVYGVERAVSGILGNIAAMITMAGLSATGLGVLLLASESLFLFIKMVGGIYLLLLGIKTWRSNKRTLKNYEPQASAHNRKMLFREAYLVGVTNPKAIVFYSALFPQFIEVEHSIIPQFILLTLTFTSSSFLALLTYALVTKKLKFWLIKEKVRATFNKVTGGIFIGFGLSLIISNKT
ncbi:MULTISPECIES: LysE family translocator [Vibrio]|uniref:LysE family translocator n=2 Tax=Vibrio TaxID=662 RepID=A0A2N7NF91_9VIBR|nr:MULTISPECIES: LysE family translocator [Vibrio]PMG49841.1 threonine transporter [Vibrio splendidus]PMP11755.1 threonine transporter [Vibrio tasmaniensis]TKG27741.1 LysE family translocator [Vibrio tasmaniensis]TKG37572.1 LysE family translocator [Vibrio tasmaniensis]TKG40428.1 LysE family translocator [Vibrio tasmaniensis]